MTEIDDNDGPENQRERQEAEEQQQYSELMAQCEQSGHMVQGDSCYCGRVTIDIANKEHGR